MAIKGGYFFKILWIDLSGEKISVKRYDEEFARDFIGGRGFGAKLLWDNIKEKGPLDPLGPENTLIVAPGPLTGCYLPSSGKNSFVTISPATGIYADSSIGGSFGVELRQTGYDAVVLGTPVYFFHINAQLKMLTDRFYCYLGADAKNTIVAGKKFVFVTSRGDAENTEFYSQLYDYMNEWMALVTDFIGASSLESVHHYGSGYVKESARENEALIAKAESVGAALL